MIPLLRDAKTIKNRSKEIPIQNPIPPSATCLPTKRTMSNHRGSTGSICSLVCPSICVDWSRDYSTPMMRDNELSPSTYTTARSKEPPTGGRHRNTQYNVE